MEGETFVSCVWGKELASPRLVQCNRLNCSVLYIIVYFEPQDVLRHGKGGLLLQLVSVLRSGLLLSIVHCCRCLSRWSWSLTVILSPCMLLVGLTAHGYAAGCEKGLLQTQQLIMSWQSWVHLARTKYCPFQLHVYPCDLDSSLSVWYLT